MTEGMSEGMSEGGGGRGPWSRLRSLLLGAIVVLIGAGIAGVATVHANPRHHLTVRLVPAPGGPPSATPVCPAAPAGNVGPRLGGVVLDPPAGFVRQPDQAVHAGVLSAPQLAAVSQLPSQAGAELVRDGFEGAVQRVWIDSGAGEQVQVLLTQFSCPEGAAEYFNSQLAGSYGVAPSEPFVIDGLGGARGERSTKADAKGHYLQVVGLVSGSIYAQTGTFTSLPDDGGLAGAISAMQAGALAPV
ncbi:MAG: hypothetical protein M3Y36_05710 [Actinomycetota bacterium]|nr:hypothetical protein [Actinomycetota bacterium]